MAEFKMHRITVVWKRNPALKGRLFRARQTPEGVRVWRVE